LRRATDQAVVAVVGVGDAADGDAGRFRLLGDPDQAPLLVIAVAELAVVDALALAGVIERARGRAVRERADLVAAVRRLRGRLARRVDRRRVDVPRLQEGGGRCVERRRALLRVAEVG